MQTRKLRSLEVSAIGLGCMGLTPIYGRPDPDLAFQTVQRAADVGVTLLDTSDAYGKGLNEQLLGRAIAGRRDRYVISTKFGNLRMPDGSPGVNGRPEYVAQACEASLKRLGIETIDLYFQHRVDPSVPIEDTVGAMAGSSNRARCAISDCRKQRRHAYAARRRRFRSRHCRPSIRYRRARSRPRSSTSVTSSASVLSPMARSAGVC